MKVIAYPAIVITLTVLVAMVMLTLGRFPINTQLNSEPNLSLIKNPGQKTLPKSSSTSGSSPSVRESISPKSQSPSSQTLPADEKAQRIASGLLRVSNRTEHPVRIVLLSKKAKTGVRTGGTVYAEPAHWDFSPGEGSRKGLILSLPEGNLQLKQGDILVAFAQDGSRVYWGPYVVGETSDPIWQRQTGEWELVLTE